MVKKIASRNFAGFKICETQRTHPPEQINYNFSQY